MYFSTSLQMTNTLKVFVICTVPTLLKTLSFFPILLRCFFDIESLGLVLVSNFTCLGLVSILHSLDFVLISAGSVLTTTLWFLVKVVMLLRMRRKLWPATPLQGPLAAFQFAAATPLPSSSLQPARLIRCVPEAHWGVIEDLMKGGYLMHLATQVEPYRSWKEEGKKKRVDY